MVIIVNLYIYAILTTLTALILIWSLYKSNEENENLKKGNKRTIDYMTEVCRGCSGYYDEKLKRYETQIDDDNDLINELAEELRKKNGI